jgi:hypothetical protein
MRSATCEVCTAYIADVEPVSGMTPDGTVTDNRIGDLRIVCDECAKTHEVIVRVRRPAQEVSYYCGDPACRYCAGL